MTKLTKDGELPMTVKEREHEMWCRGHDGGAFSSCKKASGCKMENNICVLNRDNDLANSYISGGFGFGKVCLPTERITNLLILFIYPPMFIILAERKKGFKNINMRTILTSFILTTMFYFPGLIHGLHYMAGQEYCSF